MAASYMAGRTRMQWKVFPPCRQQPPLSLLSLSLFEFASHVYKWASTVVTREIKHRKQTKTTQCTHKTNSSVCQEAPGIIVAVEILRCRTGERFCPGSVLSSQI